MLQLDNGRLLVGLDDDTIFRQSDSGQVVNDLVGNPRVFGNALASQRICPDRIAHRLLENQTREANSGFLVLDVLIRDPSDILFEKAIVHHDPGYCRPSNLPHHRPVWVICGLPVNAVPAPRSAGAVREIM